MTKQFTGQFTGRHMAAILLTFFGVVVAVNLAMARLASATFGGVVVENSYVASQNFNRWLDRAESDKDLRWKAALARAADGGLLVTVTGAPAGAQVSALARHALGREPDRTLAFAPLGGGRFRSVATLPPARWHVRLHVRSGGRTWHGEEQVR